MRFLRARWLHWVLGLALGGIFLYAGGSKLPADSMKKLVTIIWGYRLLPNGPINLVAIFMPWLEVLIGLAMVTGYKRRAGAFWASLLLTGFIAALAVNAMRGLNVACGCFSTSAEDTHNAWVLVLRDVPMFVAALVMWLFPPAPRPQLEPGQA